MRNAWLIGFVLLIVCACSEKEPNYVLKLKLLKLEEGNMYDSEFVNDFIFDAEEQNLDSLKNKSRQLFLKGIDLYKNKKDPDKAIGLFTSSILTFPEAKTYYELGNALLEIGEAKTALKAYDVTRELGFQPVSNVYYNEACAHYQLYNSPFIKQEANESEESQEDNLYEAVNSLNNAFHKGFYDTTLLKTDKRLAGIIHTEQFKEVYLEYTARRLKGNANGLYSLYMNAFPRIENCFAIKLENLELKNYTQSISYDFAPYIPEMENVTFGRSVSNDFYYVAKFSEKPNYTAVIYKSTSFEEGDAQPVHSMLATYDSKGEIISKIMLSCTCSASKVKTGKVEDGTITVEEYRRKWKQPIDKVSFDENTVAGYDLLTTSIYSIDESGKIMEGAQPVPIADSTTSASSQPQPEPKN